MTVRAFKRVESSDAVVAMALAFGRLRYALSAREEEIVRAVVLGERTRVAVAARLGMNENTLKTHVRRLLARTTHASLEALAIELLRDSRST